MKTMKTLPKYIEEARQNLTNDDLPMKNIAKETIQKYLQLNYDAYHEYKNVLNSKNVAMLDTEVRKILQDFVNEYEEVEALLSEKRGGGII